VPGDHSDDRQSFLTILDNVLNVSGSAGDKKEASRIRLNQEASLYELEGVRKMVRRQMLLRRSGSS
jgi:hypothetical protein